jgi:hypothetical protein
MENLIQIQAYSAEKKATPDQISILKDLCSDIGVKNLADFIIFAAENNVKTDGFEDLSFSDAGKLISRCLDIPVS